MRSPLPHVRSFFECTDFLLVASRAHRLSSCGAQGLTGSTACGILVSWLGIPGTVSPALQGGFLTTGPPGSPGFYSYSLMTDVNSHFRSMCVYVCVCVFKKKTCHSSFMPRRKWVQILQFPIHINLKNIFCVEIWHISVALLCSFLLEIISFQFVLCQLFWKNLGFVFFAHV